MKDEFDWGLLVESLSDLWGLDVVDVGIEFPKDIVKDKRGISQAVKDMVWRRAKGECESCGNRKDLEYDHITPFSKGGLSTYRNVQLLCEKCNREKSNKVQES